MGAILVLLLKNRQSVDQDLTLRKVRTCYAILSRLLRVTCYPTVLLKNYFRMLVHILVWPGHTNILVGMALAIPAIPLPPPLGWTIYGFFSVWHFVYLLQEYNFKLKFVT